MKHTLSDLKRYDLHQYHPCGQQQHGIMKEHEDGEYVAFEDAERLFGHLTARIRHLEATMEDLQTQVAADDQKEAEALRQAKALANDVTEITRRLKLQRNVLKRARVYLEMIVTDQHCNTGTDKDDLELIDLVLGDNVDE
ncbi:hypothetical protein [Mesorhizobium sp. SP-1A]|uniref:hypothetical protein n=1 Tax=Mesorhizobium sp. SP-1A TaxID=3077840 RepID=UPI0028F722F9|nr:hypothetical protein [Mesorhizobium sp. SP-1A]